MNLKEYEQLLSEDRNSCDEKHRDFQQKRMEAEKEEEYWLVEGEKVRALHNRIYIYDATGGGIMSGNGIFVIYPDEDNKLPKGKAALAMGNNGLVGTNTGWPLAGQAALFPESQAEAIRFAFSFVQFMGEKKVRELLPNPDEIDQKIWDWLFTDTTKDHTS